MSRGLNSRLEALERSRHHQELPIFQVWVPTEDGRFRCANTGEVISAAALRNRARVFTLHLGDAKLA